jgi:hypothetical protein
MSTAGTRLFLDLSAAYKGQKPKAITMKTLNSEQILLVKGGDRWGAGTSSTLSETQAQLLAECVGGMGGHDGSSAMSCVFYFLSRN